MSRDFILVFSGGVVSLVTTLVVLFVMDWVYRRERELEQKRARPVEDVPPPETMTQEPLAEHPTP